MLGPIFMGVAAIPEDCHLCTEISKRRTIMQATVNIKVWPYKVCLSQNPVFHISKFCFVFSPCKILHLNKIYKLYQMNKKFPQCYVLLFSFRANFKMANDLRFYGDDFSDNVVKNPQFL